MVIKSSQREPHHIIKATFNPGDAGGKPVLNSVAAGLIKWPVILNVIFDILFGQRFESDPGRFVKSILNPGCLPL